MLPAFRRRVIAAALLLASGCASTPPVPGHDAAPPRPHETVRAADRCAIEGADWACDTAEMTSLCRELGDRLAPLPEERRRLVVSRVNGALDDDRPAVIRRVLARLDEEQAAGKTGEGGGHPDLPSRMLQAQLREIQEQLRRLQEQMERMERRLDEMARRSGAGPALPPGHPPIGPRNDDGRGFRPWGRPGPPGARSNPAPPPGGDARRGWGPWGWRHGPFSGPEAWGYRRGGPDEDMDRPGPRPPFDRRRRDGDRERGGKEMKRPRKDDAEPEKNKPKE